MIPIAELLRAPTEDEALEKFLSILEAIGLPARSWRKGGALRSILRVAAGLYAGFATLMADVCASGFLETAKGPWLTLLARFVYGVERIPATFASGEVTLVNSGGGVFSFDPGGYRCRNASTGKTYKNAAAFTLNAASTLTIAVLAEEVGADGTAAPGAISEHVTTLLGVTVSNALALVGTNEESDTDLRQRCRDALGALSPNGPRGAYAFAVRGAKRLDGSPVDVNRLSISRSSSTGTVTIYVASATGTPSSTDLDAIRESIEKIARPDAVTVLVFGATTVSFSRTLIVWAVRTDGVSSADLLSFVNDALIAFVSTYPIGGIAKDGTSQAYLYADALAGVAKSAHESIFDIDGTGSDLPLNPGEVAALGTAITVRLVTSEAA